jgi:hypothetical protein
MNKMLNESSRNNRTHYKTVRKLNHFYEYPSYHSMYHTLSSNRKLTGKNASNFRKNKLKLNQNSSSSSNTDVNRLINKSKYKNKNKTKYLRHFEKSNMNQINDNSSSANNSSASRPDKKFEEDFNEMNTNAITGNLEKVPKKNNVAFVSSDFGMKEQTSSELVDRTEPRTINESMESTTINKVDQTDSHNNTSQMLTYLQVLKLI